MTPLYAGGKPSRARTVALFGFVWLMVGFASGTLVLLGPVRWLTDAIQAGGYGEAVERTAVIGVIALLVVGSAWLSWWLAKRSVHARTFATSLGIPAATTVLAGTAVWVWMTPDLVNRTAEVELGRHGQFSYGPYPDSARMVQLKDEGYTAVISLLHPAVLPFEPVLLAEEKRIAEATGMSLVHAPMLPWVNDNAGSLETIRELARTGEGKYYVHCYLGRDRVRVVQRIVEQVQNTVDDLAGGPQPGSRTPAGPTTSQSPASREEPGAAPAGEMEPEGPPAVASLERFERGSIFVAPLPVYVTPYPTDGEFLAFVLGEEIRHVVSLLDPENPEDVPWIEKERAVMAEYGMPFTIAPIRDDPFDPQQALAAARTVRGLPHPVIVHAFLTETPATQAFRQALASGLPPVPPSLFRTPLSRGAVDVLAPNVAMGPRPLGPEFGGALARRGIRRVAFVGPVDSPELVEDRAAVAETELDLHQFEADSPALLPELRRGGPWYVYGPGAESVRGTISQALGPPIPAAL